MPVGAGSRSDAVCWREFAHWRSGVEFATSGGLWLHRHEWRGHCMAHLVSTDLTALERTGFVLGLNPARLHFRPLKDPRSGHRQPAWHWDLAGPWVPAVNPKTRSAHGFERSAK